MKFVKGVPVTSTSGVSNRLGFNVSADFIRQCGVVPMFDDGQRGIYWREDDFRAICEGIIRHLVVKATGEQQ